MEESQQVNQSMLSDIERMPETPRQRVSFHRRARSDTFFAGDGMDDLLLFDPSDMDFSSFDLFSAATPPPPPSSQQFSPMAVDSPSGESSSNGPPLHPPPRDLPKPAVRSGRHLRSLSVDSDFFDDLGPVDDQFGGKTLASAAAAGERRGHHHRSSSMDSATSTTLFNFESIIAAVGGKEGGTKTMGVATDKLAELALIDPKRAKRILANRQSAARSKERKIRYTNELERKVQMLQNEATTLSAKVTMLQRGTTDMTSENSQLKLRLQALEQQAELRDALSEALREELKRLKIAATEISPVNGNSYSRAQTPQFSNQQQSTHQPGINRRQLMTNSSSSGNNEQPPNPSYTDFSRRV